MGARRTRGEGSLYQRHDHPSCPAADPDTGERPDHDCKGMWVGVVDLGWVGGKRLRRTVTARTLRECRPKFQALKKQLQDGVVADDATVEQWMDEWLKIASKELRPATVDTYRGYSSNWIVPHLGRKRLDRLRPEHIRAMHDAMEEAGLADASRRQVHAILRKALKAAVYDGRIPWNAAERVKPPKVGQGSHGKFTLEEAQRIMRETSGDQLHSRWVAALLGGLRQGEALGLTWECVNFDENILVVERAVQQVRGKGLQVVDLKSQSSYRTVPMVPPLREALWAHRQESGYVWGGEKPTGPRADWGAWKAMLARLEIPHRALHAARATTGSLLMEAGVPDKIIAEILGHSQVMVTQRHYLQGDDRMRREAMDRLGALMLGGAERLPGVE